MPKRGQITIFVIFGLALFAMLLLGFYFREQILQAVNKAELAQEEGHAIHTCAQVRIP